MKNKEYRELQITSSQLVVIFLAIIILGIVIFLLGVSVGKKQALTVSETQLTSPKPSPGKVAAKKPAAVVEENPPPTQTAEKPPEKPETKSEIQSEEKIPDKPQVKKADPIEQELTSHQGAKQEPQAKPSPSTAGSGRFYIQAGAYRNREGAYSRTNGLKALGFPAQVFDPSPGSSSQLYKVQIGGFNTREEAEAQLADLARAENKSKDDYFIVRK